MMMKNKKVSIVLPVYNGEKFISETIDSVIKQTYANWELIIINDCSTDGTLQICQNYAERDKRISVYTNPCNLKLPNSLNVGFSKATGEYYTWTSDDNIYKPKAIENLVDVLEYNSDAVMVYSNYSDIDVYGSILGEVKLQEPHFIVTGNVCGACFLYTAAIAKKVGRYDANLFLAEDYDYWMRIYRHGRIMHIEDNLYLYRHHAGSLTETKKALIQEQTYKALEKNFLALYADAKKNNLSYEFYGQLLRRGEEHIEQTKRLLFEIDRGYERFFRKKAFKESIIKRIRSSMIYKIIRG